jgi:UDP-N-acetylmuramoylalanine--D-glutamate ligase
MDHCEKLMLAIRENVAMKQTEDWSGRRVIVIGAARQGITLARYLVRRDAKVVINDRLPIDQLGAAQEALAGEPIDWIGGGHPLSILDGADLLCISGGVPFDLPIVREAQRRGIAVSNDSQIFLEVCPCRVIGITGSAGKTTTTIMVGLIAQAAIDELNTRSDDPSFNTSKDPDGTSGLYSGSKVWVGGNIGSPLLSVVDEMKPSDLAVMELSSFQLEVMQRSPEIAAILNITPNHLDRHETMQAYINAKARILDFQTSDDVAILNRDDPAAWSMKEKVHGRLVTFGILESSEMHQSVYFDRDLSSILIHTPSAVDRDGNCVIHRDDIPLRGEHNLLNVLGACAIALAADLSVSAMGSGIKRFTGIPHRLEFIRSWGGGDWYNDSIATAPERAIAAINSFTEPMILLAGGKDKNLPWDRFASLVCQRVKHLVIFGEAAGIISDALTSYEKDSETTVTYCLGLKEAVMAAANKVSDGDVVLLSPGGTSFDEFHDFEDRGEEFKKWVMELR